VLRRLLILGLLAAPAFAADWIEYRSGPFHVFSDAGDRPARERLTELEQLRFVLGNLLGKPDLSTLWPIHLVLFPNQREYGPHALPQPVIDGGSATLAAWTADVPLPADLLKSVTAILLADNVGRMPRETEAALRDLFSTIEVNATRVKIGAPLSAGALSGAALRDWAKLQMLATQPAYSGKLRIYLNNLQNAGEEDQAARNAFDTTAAKLNAQVDAYLRAGQFSSVPVIGKAFNPNRDFIEKNVAKTTIEALFAELAAGGKSFPPDSPRGLLAKNTIADLGLAIADYPKWAEPHFKMAALETDPERRIANLKSAATLDPRNAMYWETLATAQTAAKHYADAETAWVSAERAAATPQERARIHQAKLDLQENRAAFEAAEKRRAQEEEARDLQRVKDTAAAEVRQFEQDANKRMAAGGGNIKNVFPWYGDPTGEKATGTLTRVECLKGGPLRLTIQTSTGVPVRLLIRDPNHLTVHAVGSPEAQFVCGAQKPARKIEAVHDAKTDAKLGTMGDILVVTFP
jgi:hypothetical protein